MPAERRLKSFITTFIESSEPLGSPAIFRRWTAISIIAAALRQNVWVKTQHRLFPNLYIFLVAHPGVGKTRIINEGKHITTKTEAIIQAPISMTFASLVDSLKKAEIELIRIPQGRMTYNAMYITADELGAFIHKYDNEMMAGLTAFYDPTPYRQTRRTGGKDNEGIDVEIASPQLNILAGSTPQNLLNFLPETAWGQGFTSRIILVFSDHRILVDDFTDHGAPKHDDLAADLKHISGLYGPFTVTQAYKDAVNTWRKAGEPPVPDHPRLIHYLTRRRVHLYKLSMIASIDRDDAMYLTEVDFFTALEWLVSAENTMADIFKAGSTNADAQAQDDIVHWLRIACLDPKAGVSEQRIIQYARDKVPLHSILRIIDILLQTGQINLLRQDKRTQIRYFTAATGLS